jgi:hypothetical protein
MYVLRTCSWQWTASSSACMVRLILNLKTGITLILYFFYRHDAGTYDMATNTGGPHAQMRFHPMQDIGADVGLDVARALLNPLQAKYKITHSDLWAFAGSAVITNSGGPEIVFKPGRNDAVDNQDMAFQDGVLPNPHMNATGLRTIFNRMGFNDQEIVALSGAHNLGRCHKQISGFEGPWSSTPLTLTNEFFSRLMNIANYTVATVTFHGKTEQQYQDNRGLMMLPSDVALVQDPALANYAMSFASNQATFFQAFKSAFQKLLELGLDQNKLGGPVSTVLNNRNIPAIPPTAPNRPGFMAPWSPFYTNTMTDADWQNLRQDISYLVQAGNGPLLIRLAWVNIIRIIIITLILINFCIVYSTMQAPSTRTMVQEVPTLKCATQDLCRTLTQTLVSTLPVQSWIPSN